VEGSWGDGRQRGNACAFGHPLRHRGLPGQGGPAAADGQLRHPDRRYRPRPFFVVTLADLARLWWLLLVHTVMMLLFAGVPLLHRFGPQAGGVVTLVLFTSELLVFICLIGTGASQLSGSIPCRLSVQSSRSCRGMPGPDERGRIPADRAS
jgi:hypothetical protein